MFFYLFFFLGGGGGGGGGYGGCGCILKALLAAQFLLTQF